MGHMEPADDVSHQGPGSGNMSLADMEERLQALSQQRIALLEGMKEKLPDKFDPLKFDLQGSRNLEAGPYDATGKRSPAVDGSQEMPWPLAEALATCLETGTMTSSTTAASDVDKRHFQFSANVRPSRMQGVDDILSSSSRSLRGQACIASAGRSSFGVANSKAKCKPTVMPKSKAASPKIQQTPRAKVAAVPKAKPTPSSEVAAVPKARKTPSGVPSLDLGSVAAKLQPEAGSAPDDRQQSARAGDRQLSARAGLAGARSDKQLSPRTGMSGVASSDRLQTPRGGLAGVPVSQGGTAIAIQPSRTVQRQAASSSPSRSRASRFGLSEMMAPKEMSSQRQASSSPSRSRAALVGLGKQVDIIKERRMGRQPGQALWK